MDYTEIQSNRALQAEAGILLKGAWKQMALAVFVYFAITLPLQIPAGLHSLHKIYPDIPKPPEKEYGGGGWEERLKKIFAGTSGILEQDGWNKIT